MCQMHRGKPVRNEATPLGVWKQLEQTAPAHSHSSETKSRYQAYGNGGPPAPCSPVACHQNSRYTIGPAAPDLGHERTGMVTRTLQFSNITDDQSVKDGIGGWDSIGTQRDWMRHDPQCVPRLTRQTRTLRTPHGQGAGFRAGEWRMRRSVAIPMGRNGQPVNRRLSLRWLEPNTRVRARSAHRPTAGPRRSARRGSRSRRAVPRMRVTGTWRSGAGRRAAHQGRGSQIWAERRGAGGVPGPPVAAFVQQPAARCGKQPPVGRCRVSAEMVTQHGH
jgi:hypothetical protein